MDTPVTTKNSVDKQSASGSGVHKRKAEEEGIAGSKKLEKRGRVSFTPGTATKNLRRTTPARGKTVSAMAEEGKKDVQIDSPARRTLEKLFKDLGSSLTESLTKKMSEDFRSSMSAVSEKVDRNSENIVKIQDTIQRLERNSVESEKRIEERINRLAGTDRDQRISTSSSGYGEDSPFAAELEIARRREESTHDEQYELARRTLRLWPVNDEDDTKTHREAIRFVRTKLKVDESDCRDVDFIRVRRTQQARKAAIQHEVAVTFLDKHVRDVVAAHGKNLSDFVDSNGRPTAGMRIEYPSHLGRVFRDLDWYGREMRIRHGQGTRRNIKFNDDESTLYIDVCLPREEQWHRIPHQEAKNFRTKTMSERAKQSRLSLEGPMPVNAQDKNPNKTPLGAPNRYQPSGWGGSAGSWGGDSGGRSHAYTSPRRRE